MCVCVCVCVCHSVFYEVCLPLLSCRQLHHHHRRGLQDSDRGHRGRAGEAADLGHGGSGEVPNHHVNVIISRPELVFTFRDLHCSLSLYPSVHSVSSSSLQILQKHPRGHYSLRCDESRVICKCEAVVERNLPEL